MPRSEEPSFGNKARDWLIAWRIVVAVFALFGGIGGAVLLFAGKSYVKESVTQQIAGLTALPIQIKVLEDARTRESARITNNTAAINLIQQDLASIKATQIESAHNNQLNTERILNRLDAIAQRR